MVRKSKSKGGLKPRPKSPAVKLPSPMSIESMTSNLLGSPPAEGDLERAQEVIYDAWEAATAAKRVALARKALKISPLCADAHVVLAGHAEPGSDEELAEWRLGVSAGEQALGPSAFEEDVGHFWGLLETRPYMRARLGLATALWAREERDEAVAHFREMLRLNPNDNQGVRYILATWLLEADRDDELPDLLTAYGEDDCAAWSWPRALAAFRSQGDGPESRARLAEAARGNAHVAAYLLGERKLPKRLPAYISFGGENEAVAYVSDGRRGWERTTGALDWLRSQTAANPALSATTTSRARSR